MLEFGLFNLLRQSSSSILAQLFTSRTHSQAPMEQIELNDSTADRFLLDAPGVSLLVFHSKVCGNCRLAREQLPGLDLPVERLCWVDAGDNGGLVQRYEVFHLPAMFVVRDGTYFGAVQATLQEWDIRQQIGLAMDSFPAELP
jgi:hypothetical protein